MGSIAIPIHSQAAGIAGSGCGACLHTAQGPVCRSAVGQSCEAPRLSGPQHQVQRVMDELGIALTANGGSAVELVRSLRLDDGEAELVLAVAPQCSGALLADAAFEVLRRLLPDTDIYVTHAA